MPRFYFRLTNGQRSTEDRDGIELFDQVAARQEALRIIDDLLREAVETGLDWNGWEVEVLDLDQRRVHRIPFGSEKRD
jgi:hypothetical protein